MFAVILSLVLPIALVVVLVRAFQRRSDLSGEAPTISLRRFFHYLVLLGLAIIVALGLAGLVAQVLPESDTLVKRGSSAEASAIAFTIVGGPLYVFMAFWTRRRLEADPNEADSLGWAFYLSVIQLIGLAVVMTVGVRTLNWVLSDGDLDTTDAAHGLVWLAAWVVHWVIARRTIAPVRMNPHLLAGSAAALGMFAAGASLALGAALNRLYSELFETLLVDDLEELLVEAAAVAVVGLLAWWWYWLRTGVKAERTTLWNVYVLLVGVLGGLLATLIAVGVLIATTLDWLIGEGGSAVDRFDVAPEAATALLIGAAAWLYHSYLIGSGERSDVHRTYDYLVSAVGLFAVAAGIGSAIVALLDAATRPSGAIATSSDEEVIIAAVTLLVIGVPLWWITWSRIRRRARLDPEIEITSSVRRLYLYSLLGAGAVTAIVSLIVVVFTIVQDLLDGNLGTASIRDARGSVGVLLAALAVAGYHWTVYQEDRSQMPDEPASRLREVVYVGTDGGDVVRAIAAATGAKVHVWAREDTVSGSPVPVDVVDALKDRDDERVLVIQRAAGAFEIIPLRR